MSAQMNQNDVSAKPASPDDQTEGMDVDAVPKPRQVRTVPNIDRELVRLLRENPRDGADPEIRSLAEGAHGLWESVRDLCSYDVPVAELPEKGGAKEIRIAFPSGDPLHSLQFTIRPDLRLAHKLVLRGHIRSYDTFGTVDGKVAARLVNQYFQAVQSVADTTLSYVGPPNSSPLYLYSEEILPALGFQPYARGSDWWVDPRAILRVLIQHKEEAKPASGGTPDRHALYCKAWAVWIDTRTWSSEINVTVAINKEANQVSFGYRHPWLRHHFALVLRPGRTCYCLALDVRIQSFDFDSRFSHTVSMLERYASLTGASFVPANSKIARLAEQLPLPLATGPEETES